MDDAINLILIGCKQAKDLEVSLCNVANQPRLLSKSCEDIISIFSAAKQRIDHPSSPDPEQHHLLTRNPLLHTGLIPSILMPQSTNLAGPSSGSGSAGAWTERHDEGTNITMGGGEIHGIPIPDVSQERAPSSPWRRHGRRNKDEDRWTVRIGAARIGNPEIPPDDGYTWRKYGQKDILRSKFPRGYYRCTHRKLYRCPAKKQVQRLEHDPLTFEVTYRHQHTCHMSSTAPSVPPFPQLDMTHVITTTTNTQPSSLTSNAAGPWMPTTFDIAGGGRGMNVGERIVGPSGREGEYPFANSIGEEVLNYGVVGHSSGMDFMFPYTEERKE